MIVHISLISPGSDSINDFFQNKLLLLYFLFYFLVLKLTDLLVPLEEDSRIVLMRKAPCCTEQKRSSVDF